MVSQQGNQVNLGTMHRMAEQPRTKAAPRYEGLRPASSRASSAAQAASRKRDTGCEILLRAALWRRGLRYRIDVATLPGRPDIVFSAKRVLVFCDGDFWHGRKLRQRLQRLEHGHNSTYWVAKIVANVARDRRHDRALRANGWLVLRYWESDVHRDVDGVADQIASALITRQPS
jgi:DNA mismatch endonuclease (patch repair protein)